MQESAEFWDGQAESYAKSPIRDIEAYTYTLERTRSYLTSSDRVLELGCGSGSTALLLAESVGEITASDVSRNMIRIAQAKAEDQGVENLRTNVGDVFSNALGDGQYDTIMAFNLLHLLPDLPQVLRRVDALLKPGGHFISKTICRPEPGTSWGRSRLFYLMMRGVLPVMQAFGKAPPVRFMRIAELEAMVTEAGFKIIETGNYPASPPSRYIVARKAGG